MMRKNSFDVQAHGQIGFIGLNRYFVLLEYKSSDKLGTQGELLPIPNILVQKILNQNVYSQR